LEYATIILINTGGWKYEIFIGIFTVENCSGR
jgi:hypothetical protein